MNRVSLSILILFLLTVGTFSTLAGRQPTGAAYAAKPHQASISRLPVLGFDCGLGSKEAVLNGTGFPVAPSENGAFETRSSCTWIGDVALHSGAGDGTNEPLVSDQDETFSAISPKIGGGFTADVVYSQNGTSAMNGFDITVSWNPSILHAVMIDQGGTNWAAISPLTITQTINNNAGQAHLLQVVFAHYGLNFTLFRIRFDVIGIGSTGLKINNDVITNPAAVLHQTIQGSLNSESYFDPTHTLNWNGGFAVSPNPPVPGSPTTFTSTITCPGCTSPLHYQWDFNNDGVTDSTTNPATITIPTPTFFASRITLKVTDGAHPTHNATTVERLPFTAIISTPAALPVNTAAALNGIWLGGIANYAVSWRFCPGGILTTTVCSKPAPTVTSQPGQNNTQTLSGSSPGYHYSGVYNVTLKVTDSGSGPVPPSTVIGSAPVNVTGGTPVFSVQVTAQSAPVGSPVSVSIGVAYSATYPATAGFRSTLFKYVVYWGDGSTSIITNTGPSTSANHAYLTAATYPVLVVVQDLQTVSQIQETGFATVNVTPPSGFDYSLSLLPSQGNVGSGGGTASSLIIVNTLTGTPQTVSLKALSPASGITVSFNATTGLPPYASTMTVSVSPTTLDGTYNIVVEGNTTAGIAHQAVFRLIVGIVPLPVVGVFSSQYGSANITDISLKAGSTFQVQINVTSAPPFSGYELVLYYDQNYINASSYDLSTGTVFQNPYKAPNSYSGPGALGLGVVNLASSAQPGGLFTGGSGILVTVTFIVVKAGGVSPLVLAAGMENPSVDAAPPSALCPLCPTGAPNWTRLIGKNSTPLEVATTNGYFKNVAGKSGPVPSFTFSPANPSQGNAVTFNATRSFDPDNLQAFDHGIILYLWDFGDLSPQANLTSVTPVVTHFFQSGAYPPSPFSGNFSIRLTVIDIDNGFQGMKTMRLDITSSISPIVHDIGITSFKFSITQVFQGQSDTVTVLVDNFGTVSETFNLDIIYGLNNLMQNSSLVHLTGQTISQGQLESFVFILDTTTLTPGTYLFQAKVSDLFDTNPSNNVATTTIQIVAPDEPPTASFAFTPPTPVVGQDVIFNGTHSLDPDGAIVSWRWNFGDGSSASNTSPSVDHVYNVPGSYSVTLTVTDIVGLTGSETLTLQVLSQPKPQHDVGLVFVGAFPSVAVSGQAVTLEADIVNRGSNSSSVDLTFYYDGKVAVSQRGLLVPITSSVFYAYVQWDTTGVVPGNYTISATVFLLGDPSPADNSMSDGQVMILPAPVLTLVPSSGPVGTLVLVHGSGFPIPTGQFYPVEFEMTFDNQLVGLFFIQSSSFNFSFDVPDAQIGIHHVHAVQLILSTVDIQAVFTVTPSPPALTVSLSVGSIYFPGDTATIFVMTSLSGQASSVASLQVFLLSPNGSSLTLTSLPIASGIYKATYTIPATGLIGTYAVIVKAHQTGPGDGSGLASFEVKPSWLSSNSKNITTGIAITGLVGVAALAWRRGYFRKNDEEATGEYRQR